MSVMISELRQVRLSPYSVALNDVETPALIVDLPALKSNICAMATRAAQAGLSLRPHAKTHKSPHIASLQMQAGACGISCATVTEAEMLAECGVRGILLTAPQMGVEKFARIAKLNSEGDITVVVDHVRQVEDLAEAVHADARKLAVVIDIDVGQARTGATDVAEGVRLARMIASHPKLHFAGLQGFAGNAQHIVEPKQRKQAATAAANIILSFSDALSTVGFAPALITGSGTGTYTMDSAGPYSELQVGSYIFMDADYARIVDDNGRGPSFRPSLYVLSRVVSVNRPGQITVDAGTKALATNGPPPSEFIGAPKGASYRFAGDEHGIVTIPSGLTAPALGDRMLIGATHCDPTVNLHSRYYVVDGDEMQIWPIRARYGS